MLPTKQKVKEKQIVYTKSQASKMTLCHFARVQMLQNIAWVQNEIYLGQKKIASISAGNCAAADFEICLIFPTFRYFAQDRI